MLTYADEIHMTGALTHDGVYVTLVGNTRYLADKKVLTLLALLVQKYKY
jgi:hypothetical protein